MAGLIGLVPGVVGRHLRANDARQDSLRTTAVWRSLLRAVYGMARCWSV